jgi:hypothetical protein
VDEQHGRAAIKPKLEATLKLNTAEVKKYSTSKDLVQLHSDKGKQMTQLSEQLRGETGMLKLTKLPANGKGGHVGVLVSLHAESTQPRIERASLAPRSARSLALGRRLALALTDAALDRV